MPKVAESDVTITVEQTMLLEAGVLCQSLLNSCVVNGVDHFEKSISEI